MSDVRSSQSSDEDAAGGSDQDAARGRDGDAGSPTTPPSMEEADRANGEGDPDA